MWLGNVLYSISNLTASRWPLLQPQCSAVMPWKHRLNVSIRSNKLSCHENNILHVSLKIEQTYHAFHALNTNINITFVCVTFVTFFYNNMVILQCLLLSMTNIVKIQTYLVTSQSWALGSALCSISTDIQLTNPPYAAHCMGVLLKQCSQTCFRDQHHLYCFKFTSFLS